VIDKPIKKIETLRAAASNHPTANWSEKVYYYTARKLEWDAYELARRSVRMADKWTAYRPAWLEWQEEEAKDEDEEEAE
jgi:hypothetical protein